MSPDDLGALAASLHAPLTTSRAPLLERYRAVRARTLELAEPLSPEDMTAQSMADASPAKWHLAHTTWFFETFLLIPRTGAEPFDPAFGALFNSYYEAAGPRAPRPQRGLMTRPGVEQVLAYRRYVDAGMARLIEGGLDEAGQELLTLGFAHEEQHQELLLTDVLHLFAQNPLKPAYAPRLAPPPAAAVRLTWSDHAGGVVEIGAADGAFAFDNERPRHRVLLQPYRLADRLVSNAEWAAFIQEGGYRRPELWLSDGWALVQSQGWTAPPYWQADGKGGWLVFGLGGLLALEPHAPVTHVSHFEADAYARWAGARLPTEAEWEAAFAGADPARPAALWPSPAEGAGGPEQGFDALWQWTGSAYLPYPGFEAAAGAVGEYNGKFMSGQMVLRGGAFATAPGHSRAGYRNFFPPHARWQFTGVRLAQDVTTGMRGGDLRSNALFGLTRPRKRLPSKHLYDAEGSRLFEAITDLPEYYPTRTEAALLAEAAPRIAAAIEEAGAGAGVLVEYGSGASVKTRLVLDALQDLRAYAFIDISPAALAGAADALAPVYPNLQLAPIEGDFTRPVRLPEQLERLPRIGFFPGSTIGNFTPEEAQAFLIACRESLGPGALFLIGVDLVKDRAVLEAAYDDGQGVTAAFDLNLLARLNRELGADFDLSAFRHRAVWDEVEGRIEMRLESCKRQTAHLCGQAIAFVENETIHTENSYKYRLSAFEALADAAGWSTVDRWVAAAPFSFALVLLRAE